VISEEFGEILALISSPRDIASDGSDVVPTTSVHGMESLFNISPILRLSILEMPGNGLASRDALVWSRPHVTHVDETKKEVVLLVKIGRSRVSGSRAWAK
jgi:hypothetical protein